MSQSSNLFKTGLVVTCILSLLYPSHDVTVYPSRDVI